VAEIPVACTLSEDDLDIREDELKALRQLVREMCQTPNGFKLRFDGSTENWMTIAHIVAKERVCCPFLEFRLLVEKGLGSIWLEVVGSNDAAQFLLTMFGFDSQENCSSCST